MHQELDEFLFATIDVDGDGGLVEEGVGLAAGLLIALHLGHRRDGDTAQSSLGTDFLGHAQAGFFGGDVDAGGFELSQLLFVGVLLADLVLVGFQSFFHVQDALPVPSVFTKHGDDQPEVERNENHNADDHDQAPFLRTQIEFVE